MNLYIRLKLLFWKIIKKGLVEDVRLQPPYIAPFWPLDGTIHIYIGGEHSNVKYYWSPLGTRT